LHLPKQPRNDRRADYACEQFGRPRSPPEGRCLTVSGRTSRLRITLYPLQHSVGCIRDWGTNDKKERRSSTLALVRLLAPANVAIGESSAFLDPMIFRLLQSYYKVSNLDDNLLDHLLAAAPQGSVVWSYSARASTFSWSMK
jgi:hypothetical protein